MADSLMRAPRVLQNLVLKCSRMAQDMDRVWKLMCTCALVGIKFWNHTILNKKQTRNEEGKQFFTRLHKAGVRK